MLSDAGPHGRAITPVALRAISNGSIYANGPSLVAISGRTSVCTSAAPRPRQSSGHNPIFDSVNALAPTAGNIPTGIDIYGAWVANAEEDAQDAAQAYAAVANDVGVVGAVLV